MTPSSLVLRKEYFDCPQRDSYVVQYIKNVNTEFFCYTSWSSLFPNPLYNLQSNLLGSWTDPASSNFRLLLCTNSLGSYLIAII